MTDDQKSSQWLQKVVGGALILSRFGYDAYYGTLTADPSTAQAIIMGGHYLLGFVLLRGVSIEQITELVRAWRSGK